MRKRHVLMITYTSSELELLASLTRYNLNWTLPFPLYLLLFHHPRLNCKMAIRGSDICLILVGPKNLMHCFERHIWLMCTLSTSCLGCHHLSTCGCLLYKWLLMRPFNQRTTYCSRLFPGSSGMWKSNLFLKSDEKASLYLSLPFFLPPFSSTHSGLSINGWRLKNVSGSFWNAVSVVADLDLCSLITVRIRSWWIFM